MPVLERSELEQSPLADLHAIASEIGIEGYRRLRRDDLIEALLSGEAPSSEPKSGDDEDSQSEDDRPKRRSRGGRGRGRGGAKTDEGDEKDDRPERGGRGGGRGRGSRSAARDDADAAAVVISRGGGRDDGRSPRLRD